MNGRFKTSFAQSLITVIVVFSSITGLAHTSAFAGASQVETLLISDIDDTLKNTHVLDKLDVIKNALRTDNPFFGMAELFQTLKKNQNDLVFAYLSNAPESIMTNAHTALLKNANFPNGDIVLRKDTSDNEHKNRSIRALVQKYQPRNLVLIGDNGEQDTLIYARAQAEFSDLNVKVYIHQAYSVKGKETGKKLEAGQEGFVTSVDLALNWYFATYLQNEEAEELLSLIVPVILREREGISSGSLAFPKWFDCRDYVSPQMPLIEDENLLRYIEKRNRICKIK